MLGQLSIAASLARTPIDAALLGYVNLLRAELAKQDSRELKRAVLDRYLPRLLTGALVLQALVSVLTAFVVAPLLGGPWAPAIALVPLLAASAAPAAATWSLSAAIIDEARARALVPWQIMGVGLSLAAGYGFAQSLVLGAILAWIRDIIALIARSWLAGNLLSRRLRWWSVAATGIGAIVAGVGYSFLSGRFGIGA